VRACVRACLCSGPYSLVGGSRRLQSSVLLAGGRDRRAAKGRGRARDGRECARERGSEGARERGVSERGKEAKGSEGAGSGASEQESKGAREQGKGAREGLFSFLSSFGPF
jgi:hypothetical protein